MRTASEGSSTPTSQLSVPSSASSDPPELRIPEKDAVEDAKDIGCQAEECQEEVSRHSDENNGTLSCSAATTCHDALTKGGEGAVLPLEPTGDVEGGEAPSPTPHHTTPSPEPQTDKLTENREIDRQEAQDMPASPNETQVDTDAATGDPSAGVTLADSEDEAARVSMMALALENLILSAVAAADRERETEHTPADESKAEHTPLDSLPLSENPDQDQGTETPTEDADGERNTAEEGEQSPLAPTEDEKAETQAEEEKVEMQEEETEIACPVEETVEEGQGEEVDAGDKEWAEEAGRERLQEVGQEQEKAAADVPTSVAGSECVCKR